MTTNDTTPSATDFPDADTSSPALRRRWSVAERARAERLRGEIRRRRWVQRWVAGAIGRSVSTLQQALLGYRAASVTLDRIERLVAAVDAGRVVPEVHAARPVSLLDTLDGVMSRAAGMGAAGVAEPGETSWCEPSGAGAAGISSGEEG